MANNITKQSIYISTGSPSTYNSSTLYKPGELGGQITINDQKWQQVQCDSGATASTPTGVVAAGQTAFWKTKSTFTVTNDIRFAWNAAVTAANAVNAIAGVFTTAVTAGNYCMIGQKGQFSLKAASGGTWTQGNAVVANTGSSADFTTITGGQAVTQQLVGWVRGSRNGTTGLALVDMQLPDVP